MNQPQILNCGDRKNSWDSLDSKELKPVDPKGNQPWIFIGRIDVEAEYFGYLMWRADSLEKTLMLGKVEDKKRRGREKMKRLDSFTDSIDRSLNKLQEIVKDTEAWHACSSPQGQEELDRT